MTVKVGVIGCGVQGRIHLRAYLEAAGAEVVAVCDSDPVRLEEAGREFGVAGQFPDYRALLDGAGYDLISVCTMPASHREIALAALHAGANVLC